MWYIIGEIDGLAQIEKIEPALAEKVVSQLKRILAPPLFYFVGKKSGVLVFTTKEGGQELEKIADQLKRADAFLRSHSDTVESYTLVVRGGEDVQQLGREPLLVDALRYVYDVPEYSGLWCDEEAAKHLFLHQGVHKKGDFFLFVSENPKFERERTEYRILFERFLPLEEVFDQFTPCLNGEGPRIFQLIGPKGSGKHEIVRAIRSHIQGETHHMPWLDFSSLRSVNGCVVPLLEGLDEDFRDKVPEYLVRSERKVWESLSPLMDGRFEAIEKNDGLLLLYLYISAYVRYMEKHLFPPIIAVFDADTLRPSSSSIVFDLIDRGYPGYGPLWILTGEQKIEKGEPAETEEESAACELETLLEERRKQVEIGGTVGGRGDYSRYPLFSPYYEHICASLFSSPIEGGAQPAEELLKLLSVDDRSILFALSLLPEPCRQGVFPEVCADIGIEEEDLEKRMGLLSMYRLVEFEEQYIPLFPDFYRSMGTGDPERDETIKELAERYVKQRCANENRTYGLWLAEMREGIGELRNSLNAHFIYTRELLFLDGSRRLEECIGHIENLFSRVENELKEFRDELEELKLHVALANGEKENARLHLSRLSPENGEGELEKSRRMLVRGDFEWRERNFKDALELTKKALLRFQELAVPEWEVSAHLTLGKIMLSLKRTEEAVEYFHNARQMNLEDIFISLTSESSAFIALTHVMLGDYSLALSYADSASSRAAEGGRRVWERYLGMLRGKLLFELGRYEEASNVFLSLLTHERLYLNNSKKQLFLAWYARSRMYLGFTESALSILTALEEEPQQLFFTAEAFLLNRDFGRALERLDSALDNREEEDGFIYPISLLARDGFESFENVILKKPDAYDVLEQLIRSMRGFVLFRLGKRSEAEEEFAAVLEAEKLVKMNPYRHLYYFFRTLAYDDGGESNELTKATYLSKAFQSLQKVAGRITEPADRRSFLSNNYWNSKLFSMSKEHKLV